MKKRRFLIAVFIICLCLTGCMKNNKVPEANEDGEKIVYSAEEIGIESFSGHEGIFVLNEEGLYQPIITGFTGYSQARESSPERYLWFTENQFQVKKLIPVVTKNSKVVLVYNSEKAIPTDFTLEKYAYKGYTIGAHFYRDEDDSLYIQTSGSLMGTDGADKMSKVSDEPEYLIDKVNESKNLPLNNIDNNMELILGLKEGMPYHFSFYKGTKYVTFTTVADAQVFQSEKLITLENPYEKTEEGYFIVNIPDNLEDGYYYICGLGMFEYKGSA